MLSSDLNGLRGSKFLQPLQERDAILDLDFTDEMETPCLREGDRSSASLTLGLCS